MAQLSSALVLVLAASLASADNATDRNQQEINRAVWKPFKAAFENMDGTALNAIYADDVLRVTPEGVDTSGSFKQANENRFQVNIANGDRIELDFWFDSRQTTSSTSYDVGFYRLRITSAGGADNVSFYGQFHIVLKLIEDNWKIVQDWDTNQIGGRPLTAADFERRAPVQF